MESLTERTFILSTKCWISKEIMGKTRSRSSRRCYLVMNQRGRNIKLYSLPKLRVLQGNSLWIALSKTLSSRIASRRALLRQLEGLMSSLGNFKWPTYTTTFRFSRDLSLVCRSSSPRSFKKNFCTVLRKSPIKKLSRKVKNKRRTQRREMMTIYLSMIMLSLIISR